MVLQSVVEKRLDFREESVFLQSQRRHMKCINARYLMRRDMGNISFKNDNLNQEISGGRSYDQTQGDKIEK